MKKINLLAFLFVLSTLFFACSKKNLDSEIASNQRSQENKAVTALTSYNTDTILSGISSNLSVSKSFTRGLITKSFLKNKKNIESFSPVSRFFVNNAFDYTQQVEIAIWSEYVDGNHNHVEVSVDDDFVLIGGGARITSPSGSGTPNALLTAEYPKDDGNFSTFVAESKDHIVTYSHRLYVYAIGMKLYQGPGASYPIPPYEVKFYMNLTKTTSSSSGFPATTVSAPSGYTMLSGGAKINWSGAGNLLTESKPISSSAWSVKGKEHGITSPATIDAYCLSIANPIDRFGTLEISLGPIGLGTGTTPRTAYDYVSSGGWVLAGIGASATYTGNNGRLLYSMFPYNISTVQANDKDHVYSELTGNLYAYLTMIRKL